MLDLSPVPFPCGLKRNGDKESRSAFLRKRLADLGVAIGELGAGSDYIFIKGSSEK